MITPNQHICVDLDGTLSMGENDPTKWNMFKVGQPIDTMIQRVKAVLAKGIKVKIFTARVGGLYSDNVNARLQAEQIRRVIEDWTVDNFGHRLEVVAHKDMDTLQIWDDIALPVARNTGEFAWIPE